MIHLIIWWVTDLNIFFSEKAAKLYTSGPVHLLQMIKTANPKSHLLNSFYSISRIDYFLIFMSKHCTAEVCQTRLSYKVYTGRVELLYLILN